jgi:hypothetical protein
MPRFRLRTFLIAVTAFCLLLGWRVAAVESVERPIRELEKLGWEINYHVKFIDHPTPGGPVIENAPRRNYWQKLFLGYRNYDLPAVALLGSHSEMSTTDELQQTIAQSIMWINRLSSLFCLDLSDRRITSTCIKPLTGCEYIRLLTISAANIDDSAIDQLSRHSRLEILELFQTHFSAKGIAELQRRLPDCHIGHDYIWD